MRLLPRRNRAKGDPGGARAAVSAATAAGADADQRLAAASEIRARSDEQAEGEQRGIISELRAIRARNNFAALILASAEHHQKRERGGDDAAAAGH